MKLKEYLDKKKINYGEFAKSIGVSLPTLYRYFKGYVPKKRTMALIVIQTGGKVKPESFY